MCTYMHNYVYITMLLSTPVTVSFDVPFNSKLVALV